MIKVRPDGATEAAASLILAISQQLSLIPVLAR